jgi:hypothetical protein
VPVIFVGLSAANIGWIGKRVHHSFTSRGNLGWQCFPCPVWHVRVNCCVMEVLGGTRKVGLYFLGGLEVGDGGGCSSWWNWWQW